MEFLKVNFENKEALLKSFDHIADKFSNDIILKINQTSYRIVDFEFYTYAEKFPDPYTHQNKQQLENCKFYLHSSGLDITFGDGKHYGGILLRGIVELSAEFASEGGFMRKQFEGPRIVASELLSNLHPLNQQNHNQIILSDVAGHHQDACFFPAQRYIKTKRIGLSLKPEDKESVYYRDLHLRYIVILQEFPKFKQKIKGIEAILGEEVIKGTISPEEARKILGYHKKL